MRIHNTRFLSATVKPFYFHRALESLKIMDYSLLVGIHNIDQAAGRKGGHSIGGGGEESSWAGPISWDPDEGSGGGDYSSGQQRRPAMLERIGNTTYGSQTVPIIDVNSASYI
jgi:hypothetical protein